MTAMANTDPPDVRCGVCGGRCQWDGPRWIKCPRCPWSSHDPRRVGWRWRLRVFLGKRVTLSQPQGGDR